MLITSYQHLTKIERWRINVRRRRRWRKTKNERRKTKDVDRKRTEEERMLIQNKVCEKRWRVTRCSVSLLLTFIPTQLAHRPTKETFNFTGRPHKIPKMSQIRYETWNVKRETWNVKRETPAIFSHLIDSPKQMINTKMQMNLIKTYQT